MLRQMTSLNEKQQPVRQGDDEPVELSDDEQEELFDVEQEDLTDNAVEVEITVDLDKADGSSRSLFFEKNHRVQDRNPEEDKSDIR